MQGTTCCEDAMRAYANKKLRKSFDMANQQSLVRYKYSAMLSD